MKIFIHTIEKDRILIDVRAESENGEMVGDLFAEIKPGEKFLNLTFSELKALGVGEHVDPGLEVPGPTRGQTTR